MKLQLALIGFFLFVAFLFSVLGDSLRALQFGTLLGRYLGIAGIFSWFAIAFYNFPQDSFATPNLWINFGIVVGMTTFLTESKSEKPLLSSVCRLNSTSNVFFPHLLISQM